jgi:diacylglycerol kinase (ATP)
MRRFTDEFSLKTLLNSFNFAFRGILKVMQYERNMWIHLTIASLTVILGLIFHITRPEWIMIVFCIGLVLVSEITNTAIENLTDLVAPDESERAGKIKDVAAGAVLIASITAMVIGLLVFVPYLF